ncbi:hypothetical protein PP634_gp33 [Arthrobacter phage Richie]|uniref:Membrane protein n=11 Tax=Caudoviricetes TaxID=2731619 RepID=A0A9E7E7J7_9CAUD|nr:membrane protein [Arthrobacter phage Bridgette]YP_009815304.1 membrane protein [Arthrobacter phage Constance]YP_009815510.1 membrane protein [Arthrobacter phage Judy]YP_010655754.1 hypothetical protein PP634_gp33 [Arthrobacter phage Richie]YP_010655944.1 hypothetical protein PP636_gp62 [Arthrobacter phage Hestia]YP_010656122.1 hypothetical protein PP638_gp70 [Arthrobacter phage Isolde]YP_010760862.1 membrane protein [Arthrobacter phage Nandita]YP_010760929.1 membrane protein [Arthrobacter
MRLLRWAALIFPVMLFFMGIAGFAKWVRAGAAPADSLVWIALSIAAFGWAATHIAGFILPAKRETD